MSAAVAEMRRPADDRVLFGVCAGLAARLQLDVTLVRVVTAVGLVVLTAPFLVAYAAFALVVPRTDGRMLIGGEPADRRESILGWLLVLTAAGVIIATPGLLGTGDIGLFGIGALIVGLSLVGLAVSRSESRKDAGGVQGPPPVPPNAAATDSGVAGTRPGTSETAVLGEQPTEVQPQYEGSGHDAGGAPGSPAPRAPSVLVPTLAALAGLVGFSAVVVSVFDLDVTAASIAILSGSMAVACGGVVMATWGRRGSVPLIIVATFLALFASAIALTRDEIDRGVGYRELARTTPNSIENGFEIGIGYMQIDLRDAQLPPGETTMPLHVGLGAAGILVPRDLEVVSSGDSIGGDVDLPAGVVAAAEAESESGASGRKAGKRSATPAEPPVLVIDADIGVGEIDISREGQSGLF